MSTTTDLHAHASEVDTRIAALFTAWTRARMDTATEAVAVRRAAGQRQDYSSRRWSGTLAEAMVILTDMGDDIVRSWGRAASEFLADYAAAGERQTVAGQVYADADEEYDGWSRFFLVTGGHIHSSMGCHTCYPTTEFGWLPQLSGLTEADAVAVYGPVLCSVCYPSAPVESTGGYSDGLTLAEQAERRAEKAAKSDAKAAKLLTGELQFRDLAGHQVTTVAGAKTALREAAKILAGWGYVTMYGENAPSVHGAATAALLAKGMTTDDVATLAARAVKAGAKEGWSH